MGGDYLPVGGDLTLNGGVDGVAGELHTDCVDLWNASQYRTREMNGAWKNRIM
jgi:hypothetical protein